MFLHCYFHPASQTLVFEAQAKTKAGFYVAHGLVEVVPFGDEKATVEAAQRIWEVGLPEIPTPDRDSFKKFPAFKLPGVRTFADVERNCSLWHLDQSFDTIFTIQRWISPPRERGFVPDQLTSETLPIGTTLHGAIVCLMRKIRCTTLED